MITTTYLTLEDYLTLENNSDYHCELIAGELVPMPPESRTNARIAMSILKALMALIPAERLCCKDTEIEVTGKRTTVRLPDLIVLSEELVPILENQSRSLIRREMPAPSLVVEVVSPGKEAEDRDYRYKRSEYAARGIPEYWIVDPIREQIVVLILIDGFYESTTYQKGDHFQSTIISDFSVSVKAILE